MSRRLPLACGTSRLQAKGNEGSKKFYCRCISEMLHLSITLEKIGYFAAKIGIMDLLFII